jgi:hypothetical protein
MSGTNDSHLILSVCSSHLNSCLPHLIRGIYVWCQRVIYLSVSKLVNCVFTRVRISCGWVFFQFYVPEGSIVSDRSKHWQLNIFMTAGWKYRTEVFWFYWSNWKNLWGVLSRNSIHCLQCLSQRFVNSNKSAASEWPFHTHSDCERWW